MSDGDYSIGSDKLNGLSKVIEECGEVVQVAAKIIGNNGSYVYWDEPDLKKLLIEELGDVIATIDYFGVHNLT